MPERQTRIVALLRRRVVAGLHLGTLKPGDRLPSARTLAGEFDTDQRTVVAAFRALERDGLIEVRARSGAYVAEHAVSAEWLLPQFREWVAGVLMAGLARGVPPRELPERLRRCLETLRLHATCVECNTDQMEWICFELHRDYGLETSGMDLDTLTSGTLPPELQRTDLLVSTAFHSTEIRRIAERVRKPWIAIVLHADYVAETRHLLTLGPVYLVVADPRFADKLRAIYADVADVADPANLRPLVVGRDDLAQIPAGAPTYVTRAARERLGDTLLPSRVAASERMFSTQSAYEVVSFVLRENMATLAAKHESDRPAEGLP